MVRFLKSLVHPYIRKIYRRIRVPAVWGGRFPNWASAQAASGGYDDSKILNKVASAVQQVVVGKAAFERDSVLFFKEQFNWHLLGPLLVAAGAHRDHVLTVIDFGGSLGSSYLQNKKILAACSTLSWKIVEQPHYVEVGREIFPSGPMQFHKTLSEAWPKEGKTFLLFASVLQYLPDPELFLRELILLYRPDYIFIERTTFCFEAQNRLTVQKVPPQIYEASYPCWFFTQNFFEDILSEDYIKTSETIHQDVSEDFNSCFKNLYYVTKSIALT